MFSSSKYPLVHVLLIEFVFPTTQKMANQMLIIETLGYFLDGKHNLAMGITTFAIENMFRRIFLYNVLYIAFSLLS